MLNIFSFSTNDGSEKEKQIWDITKQGIRGESNGKKVLFQRVNALKGLLLKMQKNRRKLQKFQGPKSFVHL